MSLESKSIANDTWITWHNQRSGNRTTRAHIANGMNAGRTLCGWSMGDLTTPAPKSMQRCTICTDAIKSGNARTDQNGWK